MSSTDTLVPAAPVAAPSNEPLVPKAPSVPAAPTGMGEESTLEQLATGLEQFGAGVSADIAKTVGRATGGVGVEAREAKYPKTAKYAHMAGELLRAGGAVALAGPAALFLNSAISIAGDAADKAYAKDPRLTREYVLSNTIGETIGDLVALAIPPAGAAIKAGGKMVAGKALSTLTKTLTPYAENYVAAGGKIGKLAEKAAKAGFFSKTAAGATEYAEKQMGKIGGQMEVIHQAVDSASDGFIPSAMRKGIAKASRAAKADLLQNQVGDKAVTDIMFDVRKEAFTPATLLRSEQRIRDAIGVATKANDGHTVNVLTNYLGYLRGRSDRLMVMNGINPAQYRELQTMYAGAVALQKSVGTAAGGEAAKAAAGMAGKAAIGATVGHGMGGALAGAVLGEAGLKAVGKKTAAETIMSVGKARAAQAAYTAGRTFSNFEKTAFADFIGRHAGAEAGVVVERAAAVAASRASKPKADAIMQLLTEHQNNPQAVLHRIGEKLDKMPIPQEYKDAALNDASNALMNAQTKLSMRIKNPNPLAPAANRALTPQEKRRMENYMHGVIDPAAVLNHPTAEGIEAVRDNHPATYQAFQADLISKLGPNAPINSPLRVLANKHGLDRSQVETSMLTQTMYNKAKQPPQPPRGARNSSRNSGTMGRDQGRLRQTAQGAQQERRELGE